MENITEEIRELNRNKALLEKETKRLLKIVKDYESKAEGAGKKLLEINNEIVYEKASLKEALAKRQHAETGLKSLRKDASETLINLQDIKVKIELEEKRIATKRKDLAVEITRSKQLLVSNRTQEQVLDQKIIDHKAEQAKYTNLKVQHERTAVKLDAKKKELDKKAKILTVKEAKIDETVEIATESREKRLEKDSQKVKILEIETEKLNRKIKVELAKAEKSHKDAQLSKMNTEAAKESFNKRNEALDIREKGLEIRKLRLDKLAREKDLDEEYLNLQRD